MEKTFEILFLLKMEKRGERPLNQWRANIDIERKYPWSDLKAQVLKARTTVQ